VIGGVHDRIPHLLALATWLGLLGVLAALAQQGLPDLSGTYKCVPDHRECRSSTFSVVQSGTKLDVTADQGETGSGTVTSGISVTLGPPWNVFGTILPDRTIEWSTGTRWQKQ
jgi:hypothetical protein